MSQIKYITSTAFLDDEFLGTKVELFNDHVDSRIELVDDYTLTDKQALDDFLRFKIDEIELEKKMYDYSIYKVIVKLEDAYELIAKMEKEVEEFALANDLL